MSLSVEQWQERFQQQSSWTASLRAFLFSQVDIASCQNILEVGSGTGVITKSLKSCTNAEVIGVDFDFQRSRFASSFDLKTRFLDAEAENLPFVSGYFDLTYCHYLLLWLREPISALKEMIHVTRPGGKILALAEPDYFARIDNPPILQSLGHLQTQSLVKQGACPDTGRHLGEWFICAGLTNVQMGVSGFQIPVGQVPDWFESEWQVLQTDLVDNITDAQIKELKELDNAFWKSGQRLLWVPTFYAIGTVPEC